jgi:hypothetical protein
MSVFRVRQAVCADLVIDLKSADIVPWLNIQGAGCGHSSERRAPDGTRGRARSDGPSDWESE